MLSSSSLTDFITLFSSAQSTGAVRSMEGQIGPMMHFSVMSISVLLRAFIGRMERASMAVHRCVFTYNAKSKKKTLPFNSSFDCEDVHGVSDYEVRFSKARCNKY